MPGRLGPRFALEAVFLIALAVAMGLADLTATAIVVVMTIAWLLVAIVEWLASRDTEPRELGWRDSPYAARGSWAEPEPEPETELVPPAPAPAEEQTADPIEQPAPPEPRRRRFGRRRAGEESRAER